MADYTLTPSQRAFLFTSIDERGLDPRAFELITLESEYTTDTVTEIKHNASGFFFRLNRKKDHNYRHRGFAEFSPGENFRLEHSWIDLWREYQLEFNNWLDRFVYETETPDLWLALEQERLLVDTAIAQQDESIQFNEEEQALVGQAIHELKNHIFETQHLIAEHKDFVEVRLNYLEGAARRQGKVDWLQTAIGVLFTIVMILPQPQEAAREIFRHFGVLLSGIFGGGTPLLP